MKRYNFILIFIFGLSFSCASRVVVEPMDGYLDPICLNRDLNGVFKGKCNEAQEGYLEFKKEYDWYYSND